MTGWKLSRTVLLFIAMALGLGAIGALLAAPTLPAAPIWYPGGTLKTSASLIRTASLVLAGLTLAPFAYLLYHRVRNRTLPVPLFFANIILVSLLVAVILVTLIQLFPAEAGPTSGSSGNGTGPILPFDGGKGFGSNGSGPSIPGLQHVPPWVPYAVIAAAALLIVAIVGPRLFARAGWSKKAPPSESRRAGLEEELQAALRRMASEPLTDPRAIILALYARLIVRVHRIGGDTEALTPREIASLLEVQFQVRPRGARELTRIFEEARYSTGPLSPGSTEAMRGSLEETLADLRHAAPAGGR